MVWQDPMQNNQEKETRRRIKNVLKALIDEFGRRNVSVSRIDENTIRVKGMTLTASDQVSDTYNDVCYLVTDYDQLIECTLSRIEECADNILGLTEVQVEKCSFSVMVDRIRSRNHQK